MKKTLATVALVLLSVAVITSCKKDGNDKDDDYASKVVGTYNGMNEYKIESTAQVVITRNNKDYVSVQYDINTEEEEKVDKELAPAGLDVRVRKRDDGYILTGKNNITEIDGTVTGATLKMKVYIGSDDNMMEIMNFVGTRE